MFEWNSEDFNSECDFIIHIYYNSYIYVFTPYNDIYVSKGKDNRVVSDTFLFLSSFFQPLDKSEVTVDYVQGLENVEKIINGSFFCVQSVNYRCKVRTWTS